MMLKTSLSGLMMLGLALSLAGCATLDPARLGLGLAGSQATAPTPPRGPMVAVEFHAADTKAIDVVPLPLTPNMTVQEALDQARASKRFRRLGIDLMRNANQTGEPHKMAIAWDNGKKRVAFSTNYALHPNDRIMVTENTDTALDDMVAKIMGNPKKKKRQ